MLALWSCEGVHDLPPVVATSEHFRYHARSAAEVPDGTLLELEAHRTDVLTYFGQLASQDGRIVDYYRFADVSDRVQGAPCGVGPACEEGGKVYSVMAADEFELVHAYLSGVGRPPRLFQEGMGAVVSWGNFNAALGPITCGDAPSVSVPSDVDNVTVTFPRAPESSGGMVWYIHLSLESARLVTVLAPYDPGAWACAGCGATQCASLAVPQTPVSGDLIFELTAGSNPDPAQTGNQWVQFRFQ